MKKPKKQTIKGVPRTLRKIISKAVRDYRWQLGMQVWDIDISYAHEDRQSDNPGDEILASMSVSRRYLEATLNIYPFFVKRFTSKTYSEEKVRETIAHEVAHIATQHFWDVATARYCDEGEMKDAWETCTTVLGKLLYKLQKHED